MAEAVPAPSPAEALRALTEAVQRLALAERPCRADEALYEAKSDGRDRVAFAA